MKRLLACIVLAAATSARLAPAQVTPVILVHGILSNSHTWGSTARVLQASGRYTPHAIDVFDWTDYLATEGHDIAQYLSDSGYGPSAILVGHSQGGLVSRLAIRSDSVFGILTIGSPHAGTSLADAAGSINSYATAASLASATAKGGLDDEAFCDPFDDPICNDALDALDQLGIGITPWQVAFEIGQAYTSNFDPDLAQLSPFSSVIADTLETLYAGERAARRFSIQVEDADEDAGPFRLTAPANVADPEMENMIITGAELALDGLGIATRIDPENDPNYLEHEEAGDALSVLGPILDGFPYLWNDWVAHGFANDGAVPYASQVIPNATLNIPLSGFAHTEETEQASLILTTLDAMKNTP